MKIDCGHPGQCRFTMSESEYRAFLRDDIGLCLNCGGEREACEPDARKYPCPDCREPSVYGAEELLLRGRITLT
jgi:hypothetical protein